jgi:hypothetical protein
MTPIYFALKYEPDMLSRNVGNYRSTLHKFRKREARTLKTKKELRKKYKERTRGFQRKTPSPVHEGFVVDRVKLG